MRNFHIFLASRILKNSVGVIVNGVPSDQIDAFLSCENSIGRLQSPTLERRADTHTRRAQRRPQERER